MIILKWPLFAAAAYFGWKTILELTTLVGLTSGIPSFFWMSFFLAGTAALVWAGRRSDVNATLPKGQVGVWLAQFPNAHHSHHSNKTGIALDDQARIIHLLEGKISKSYSYDDVRSWNTNVQTGGVVYGGGFAGAIGTIEAGINNVKNTGLFITVKDVEHPEWRISLCKPNHRDARKIHARWIEILAQAINLDRPAVPPSTQVFPNMAVNIKPPIVAAVPHMNYLANSGSKVFCPECGSANDASSKFCKSCGQAL